MVFDPSFGDILAVRIVLGLVIGLVLGSFTTMLSYRIPRRLSIVTPPSHCPHCRAQLTVRDLVPVFSWLSGKGKCRYCGHAIGARYIAIELLTTLAVTAAFVGIGLTPALIAALLGIIALVTMITINLERR
ncbi:MAG: prepilin peptidase [Alphaproteobacteria bacterium]|nr:prepilin peptidase [Alphaproteobacteria bacterium]